MRYTREDGCRAWLAYGELHPEAMAALLDEFGSCEAAYDQFLSHGPTVFKVYAGEKQLKRLSERSARTAMHEMMSIMQRLEMGIITPDDDAYPAALRDIPDPPFQLFYRGDPSCLSRHCVTMVGSRKASASGISATRTIAQKLSQSGVCIVSGVATGIDTASLEGALDGGAPAAGVLACGLDVDYPSRNSELKRRILATGGVLLSEYPPGVKALPYHFRVRNRIMSGLSSAVLMMECGIRSGSMITVQHALDQGREVYAYPGDPGTHWSEGAHCLLREGANYFALAQDVLEDMGWPSADDSPQKSAERPAMSAAQQRLCKLLERGEMSYDELAAATGMDSPSLSSELMLLLISGLIEKQPGNAYRTVKTV